MGRTGVWIIGARGGVATTLACGLSAIRQGLAPTTGLITASELCRGVSLVDPAELVLGGHDVRTTPLPDCAREISRANGSLAGETVAEIEPDLARIDANLRPGVLFHSGTAIESLPGVDPDTRETDPGLALARIERDLAEFRATHALERLVVVNLASTEPPRPTHPAHHEAALLEAALTERDGTPFIASTLYSLAAARHGAAYLNFTPSPGALIPAVAELLGRGCPFMGSDGKTGETLVKSALAPMFRYRNLRVLSWQGYNLLGDRDGAVLANDENRQAKIRSKDQFLHEYLGYPLHSKVTIDYVPSLDDWKTAWDFIHFEGFLGVRMNLQFTWQGCDSILAAPLVIDLVRLLDLALRRGERGPLAHLAVFFKSPHGVGEHDLHRQFHSLEEYLSTVRRSIDER
jgi:myo-inositol-1-phosphate synthase